MIAYQFDADTGKSAWYSVDQNLDGYTSQFFSNGSERSTLAAMPSEGPLSMWLAWKAPAPDAMLSAPVVELIEASTNDEGVTYRLYIQSIRQALNMEVRVQSQGEIVSGTVNNKGFELKSFPTESRNLLRLQYYGVPSEGFDFVVTTQSRLSIVVTVEDRSYGLPTLPGYEMTRPDSYMPAFHELSDATLVKKTFQFQVAPPIPDGN
jgi:hypothetical protein